MRVKWKVRRGKRPSTKYRYICELRRSERRARRGQPLRQRKLTIAHLGTLSGPRKMPDLEEWTRFLARVWDRLLEVELPASERTRLLRDVVARFPLASRGRRSR